MLGRIQARSGESMAIGGILGGTAGPITGGIVDKTTSNKIRKGKLDQKMVSTLVRDIEHQIRANINIEKETWVDAKLANPKTAAGKRLKTLQAKMDEIVQGQSNGQTISDIFKTPKQQEEFTKRVVSQMQSATKLESKIIQASKIKGIKERTRELDKAHAELEKAGVSLVSRYAEKFDDKSMLDKYLGTTEGKSISQALIGMKKALGKLKKEKAQALGEEVLTIQAEIQSLEDVIADFEAVNEGNIEGFDDTSLFSEGLSELPQYKKMTQQAKDIANDIEEQVAQHKEWAERANMPEVFDFIDNDRVTMGGHAMYKISREQSIKAFTDGLAQGQAMTEASLVDVVKSVAKIIKSMPFNKGRVLGKQNKEGILKELNKMKDRLTSKTFSRADLDKQTDIVADMLNDMMEVSKQMTAEGSYQAFVAELKKVVSNKAPKRKPGKPRTLDADLNDSLAAMKAMMGKNYVAAYEEYSKTGANEYRQVVDNFYQLREQEESVRLEDGKEVPVLSQEELAEAYAGMVDGVEWLVEFGYIPDAGYLKRAAEIKAVKDIMSRDTVEMGQKRLSKVRKSPKYFVQDSLFNPGFETLNTLWVKLGVQDIETFDLTKADMGKRNALVEWRGKLKKISKKLGLSNKDIAKWSDLDSEQTFTYTKSDGTVKTLHLTKGQVMQRVMVLKNKEQRAQAQKENGMGYTDSLIKEMEDSLTDTESKFVREMMKVYEEAYTKFSPIYKKMFLMSLPKVDNYSPAPKRGKDSGNRQLTDTQFLGPDGLALPSMIKSRVDTLNEFMDVGVVETMTHYLESMEHTIHYQEKISNINNIITNDKVSQSIKQRIGEAGYKRLKNHLEYIENMGQKNSEFRIAAWDYFNKVYIVNNLMFKVNQIFKQTTSFLGLLEDVPLSYSIPRMAKGINPFSIKRWRKILRENETIRNRGEHIDADYNALLDNETIGMFSEQNTIVKWGMAPTVIGDVGAIYIGGGIYYDYLISQGISHEQALDTVARKAEMSQQSSLPSNMTLLQKSNNSFARSIRMFSSASISLMNMQVQSYTKWRQGDISKEQFFKNLAIYQVAIPALYALMAGQISFDDEDEMAAGLLHASLKGNFGGLPMVGEGLDTLALMAANDMTDEELKGFGIGDTENPVAGVMRAFVAGINIATGEKDFTEEEAMEALLTIADSTARLGARNSFNSIQGLADMVGGGDPESVLNAFGYSDRQTETMSGNKRTK